MECVFCNIINKKAEAHVICESDHIMAFLDIEPINEVAEKIREALQ